MYRRWEDDKIQIQNLGLREQKETLTYIKTYVRRWFAFQTRRIGFGTAASWMDWQAYFVLTKAWLLGLFTKGLEGAWRARAGLQ